ncbi:MAG: hypothetical protein L0Z07_08045, partial [Planctomycetes bacterium]|nr:hypothetical protein [Planctomycetota bacterium]
MAVFTVTNLNDAAVIAAGDAPGTLRQAIFDANAALGADDIAFQAGLTGTILLTKGELAITEALTITGPGAAMLTVDASGNDPTPLVDDGLGSRIFNINDGVAGDSPVTISGLTITGGDANSSGGGIRSLESLTLLDSVVSGNATTDDGAGVFVSTSAGTATITRSTISGNVAPTSGDFGGGLYAYTNSGSITIRDSTIANNLAFYGGGIWARTVAAAGNTTITGSTISGNDANQSGGGIYVQTGAGTTTIAHSTISDNTANADLGVIGHGGGLYASETGTLNILHTIIAGNVDANVVTRAPDLDITHAATIPTLDIAFSLIGNNSGSGLAAGMPDANGNLIGTAIATIDPLLGPLANNGGPTQTRALLAGSPAIDTGNPAVALPPTNDQRGAPFLRIVDGDGAAGARIDIGAYERQTVAALARVVDTLVDENDGNYAAGDLSLREAVGLANGSIGVDTITFAAALSGGTITLSLGEIGISEAVTIDSSSLAIGIKIDAAGNDPTPLLNNGDGSRIFNIDDGNPGTDNPVTFVDLTLTGGDVTGDGGAVRTLEGLSVIDSVIRNNSAFGDTNDGGGIFAGSLSGTVNILRSTIADNLAGQSGGGLAFETNSGDLAITDSTMSGNDTVAYGGGIVAGASTGTISITSSTFSNNATLGPSASGGGGLFARTESGTTTVINSTFSGNMSEDSGGGIYAISNTGTTTITHTTITGGSTNSAGGFGSGGGLYMAGAGGLVLKHTIIAGNSDNTNIAPDLDLSSKFTGS